MLMLQPVLWLSWNAVTQLISILGVFGLGFLIRPVGGLIFGSAPDKIGRKRILVITVPMMSGATFLIGVLPSYGAVGALAPALLLIVRLVQGFSAGGETGTSMVLIAEYVPPHRRGLTGMRGTFANVRVSQETASSLHCSVNESCHEFRQRQGLEG